MSMLKDAWTEYADSQGTLELHAFKHRSMPVVDSIDIVDAIVAIEPFARGEAREDKLSILYGFCLRCFPSEIYTHFKMEAANTVINIGGSPPESVSQVNSVLFYNGRHLRASISSLGSATFERIRPSPAALRLDPFEHCAQYFKLHPDSSSVERVPARSGLFLIWPEHAGRSALDFPHHTDLLRGRRPTYRTMTNPVVVAASGRCRIPCPSSAVVKHPAALDVGNTPRSILIRTEHMLLLDDVLRIARVQQTLSLVLAGCATVSTSALLGCSQCRIVAENVSDVDTTASFPRGISRIKSLLPVQYRPVVLPASSPDRSGIHAPLQTV
ncbi:hypothetical protein R3P38DRAFT_3236044 [Favolaschia claudopus]|uniref:Uncharacterized protein n=1 Tax=Favolaschia claudopus TaxID=2862362 RepID=A0AAV9ZCA9_9AGAR